MKFASSVVFLLVNTISCSAFTGVDTLNSRHASTFRSTTPKYMVATTPDLAGLSDMGVGNSNEPNEPNEGKKEVKTGAMMDLTGIAFSVS